MPFERGRAKTGGRKKGTVNKITKEFRETLEIHNFDPAMSLIEIYHKAMHVFDNYATIYENINKAREQAGFYPTTDNAHQYLRIAADTARDIASYSYPKLKSIEHTKKGVFAGLSDEQKLEMAKQAVKVLEGKMHSGSGGSEPNS